MAISLKSLMSAARNLFRREEKEAVEHTAFSAGSRKVSQAAERLTPINSVAEASQASKHIKVMLDSRAPVDQIVDSSLRVFLSPQSGNFSADITKKLSKAMLEETNPERAKALGSLITVGQNELRKNISQRHVQSLSHPSPEMAKAHMTNNLHDAEALLASGASGELRTFANKAAIETLEHFNQFDVGRTVNRLASVVQDPKHFEELKALSRTPEIFTTEMMMKVAKAKNPNGLPNEWQGAIARDLNNDFTKDPAGAIKLFTSHADEFTQPTIREAMLKRAIGTVSHMNEHVIPLPNGEMAHSAIARLATKPGTSEEVQQKAARMWNDANYKLGRADFEAAESAAHKLLPQVPANSAVGQATLRSIEHGREVHLIEIPPVDPHAKPAFHFREAGSRTPETIGQEAAAKRGGKGGTPAITSDYDPKPTSAHKMAAAPRPAEVKVFDPGTPAKGDYAVVEGGVSMDEFEAIAKAAKKAATTAAPAASAPQTRQGKTLE